MEGIGHANRQIETPTLDFPSVFMPWMERYVGACIMYHFSDQVDWRRFFRFDKRWIESMSWSQLSPAAKAVLPVIACYGNARGEAFPGEKTIAGLSGLTEKTVRQGIHDLEGFPGFTWGYYHTRNGKRGKRFTIVLPPKGMKGRSFFFYRGIMDSGIWSKLKPTAKAIYPVLRCFARYLVEEDETVEYFSNFVENYPRRRWEVYIPIIGKFAKYAGINRRSFVDAERNLQENFLLSLHFDDINQRRIHFIPEESFNGRNLNNNLNNQAES